MRQVFGTDILWIMSEYSYSYQSIDEEEHREKKMKAQIDREQMGEQRLKGLKIVVKGRIRGGNRKQKKVVQYGKQNQQDRLSRIDQGAGVINTRYGTLGIKVQSAKERKEG